MSVVALKAHRDAVVKAGIGTFLDVTKGLIAAIDKHLADDASNEVAQSAQKAEAALAAAEATIKAHEATIAELHSKLAAIASEAN